MFSTYLKSVLIFNRSQNKAPNVILVYLLISLAWHHKFFTDFFIHTGSFAEKLNYVLLENNHQYFVVLCFTLLFFILRLSYLYFANKTDQFIDADEPIETKIGSDQLFTENKDVIRLVALLDETKAQLAQAKEAEALARTDKTIAIGQVLSIQAELDLALADIAILSASNQELRSQFNEVAAN